MDALKLLKDDHRRIRDLLAEGEDDSYAAVERRRELLHNLTREIKVHERREEELLYPAIDEDFKARHVVLESEEELHFTDAILSELNATAYNDERWPAKFKVLKDTLERHILEEEHDIFRKARRLLDREQLEMIGDQMAQIRPPEVSV